MCAAALLALERGPRYGFGDRQQIAEIERGVPAGVVFAIACHSDMPGALAQFQNGLQGLLHLFLAAHDAHLVLHHVLQVMLDLIGTFARALERFERLPSRLLHLRHVDGGGPMFLGEFRGVLAGAFAEYQQVGKRISAQPVRSVQARAAFPGGEQSGDVGHLGVAIHSHPAHHVVRGGADLHGLRGDVDIAELLELVIHAGQLFLDVLGRVWQFFLDPGDVEIHAAVRAATALAHFARDAARHVVAREQLRRTPRAFVALRVTPAFLGIVGGLVSIVRWHVVEHEALALVIQKNRRLRRARLR